MTLSVNNADPVRLTQLAKRAGCAAKQPPGYLLPLLGLVLFVLVQRALDSPELAFFRSGLPGPLRGAKAEAGAP